MKQWLRELFDQYLANVAELTLHDRRKAEAWAGWMKAKWAEQGFSDVAQQQPLMEEVRAALKSHLGDQHIALATLRFAEPSVVVQSPQPSSSLPHRNGTSPHPSPSTVNGRTLLAMKPHRSSTQEDTLWTLTTHEAYEIARSRGYEGKKSDMQRLVRESVETFAAPYGLLYRSEAVFGRYAKNWQDLWATSKPGLPKPKAAPAMPSQTSTPAKELVAERLTEHAAGDAATQQLSQVVLWLIQDVERLRQQLQDGQLQDEATAGSDRISSDRTDEYHRLKMENERLKAERLRLLEQLKQVQSLTQPTTDSPPVPQRSPHPSSQANGKTTGKSGKRGRPPKPKPTQAIAALSSDSSLDPYAVQAMEAVMAYNNAPGRSHHEKWVISYPVMKELLKQVGASTQPKIQHLFATCRAQIQAHHDYHQLTSRHNRVHGDRSISDIIRIQP